MQARYRDRMSRPLTTTEVAALTDPPTTRFTVEREIGRGNLAAQKVGGRWLTEAGEAQRWAAAYQPFAEQRQRHKPASE